MESYFHFPALADTQRAKQTDTKNEICDSDSAAKTDRLQLVNLLFSNCDVELEDTDFVLRLTCKIYAESRTQAHVGL